MDVKLKKLLVRLKQQFKVFESELEEINQKEDGMNDISTACVLANSVPYLIKQLEYQHKLNELQNQRIEQLEKESEKNKDGFLQGVIYSAGLIKQYQVDSEQLLTEAGITKEDALKYADDYDLENLGLK